MSHPHTSCLFPCNTRALAVPMWPSSVSRTVAPRRPHPPPPPPAQTDIRRCRNPRPVRQATGGRNSFTRFSGRGWGERGEKGGRESSFLGADLRIRSDVIASEKLNSPVLWGLQINIFSGCAHKGRSLWPRLNACE